MREAGKTYNKLLEANLKERRNKNREVAGAKGKMMRYRQKKKKTYFLSRYAGKNGENKTNK